jgi:RNA polymerase subunit RPABC4/transcription elongation factor Spt4
MDTTRPHPPLKNQLTPSMLQAPRMASPEKNHKRTGYGLPCSKCHTYFAADLTACPMCGSSDREGVQTIAAPMAAVAREEYVPTFEEIEAEREAFLREFKGQLYASPLESQQGQEGNRTCTFTSCHPLETEEATICSSCYSLVADRADRLEAALHIDLREATRIVYEAVWADPSNPNDSYKNAAHALLDVLRKRAGIKVTRENSVSPYAH